MHHNVAGQVCDGTLCVLCTRCSNCKHQKPGTYKRHEHVFGGTLADALADRGIGVPAPPAKTKKQRSKSVG